MPSQIARLLPRAPKLTGQAIAIRMEPAQRQQCQGNTQGETAAAGIGPKLQSWGAKAPPKLAVWELPLLNSCLQPFGCWARGPRTCCQHHERVEFAHKQA